MISIGTKNAQPLCLGLGVKPQTKGPGVSGPENDRNIFQRQISGPHHDTKVTLSGITSILTKVCFKVPVQLSCLDQVWRVNLSRN